jgi:hypothetical protein
MKSLHSRFMEENPDFKCCVKSIHTWVRQIGFKFRKNEYSKFIQEYLQLNHMQLIKTTPKNDAVYLPHHAVVLSRWYDCAEATQVVVNTWARLRRTPDSVSPLIKYR